MEKDIRLYRRSTLLQLGIEEEVVDGLEVLHPSTGTDGRFQLLTDSARLQIPSCSYISRTIDDEWFIDTGVEIDQGQLYIGRRDFEGLASVAGYVSSASVARIMDESGRVKNELDVAHSLIADLRASIASLVGFSENSGIGSSISTQQPSEGKSTPRRAAGVDPELDLTIEE